MTQSEGKFIKVFSTPNPIEVAMIKSVLDGQRIEYFIKGENFGTLYGPANGFSSMDVMVREGQAEDAKNLLTDFIDPKK